MNKDSLLSLSGSLDLDSYDIGDVIKNSNSEQRQFKKEVNKDSNSSDNNGGSIIADSLDLDNSDDLNKIIQKYE